MPSTQVEGLPWPLWTPTRSAAPSTRTDTGYRLYDDHDLARLSFIRRAKQLGCSLEEITDLVDIWDGERCGPVQHRFHDLVANRIADAEQQILELNRLTAQLRTAAGQLAGPATDGACGEGCACLVDISPAGRRIAAIGN